MTVNLTSLNSSIETLISLVGMIDLAITEARAIEMNNYNRSTVLRSNATELCTLATSLEQVKLHNKVARLHVIIPGFGTISYDQTLAT